MGLPTDKGAGRVDDECTVRARFFEPPVGMRRYFTSFYLTEVDVADGGTVTDWLHPEWGGLRIGEGLLPAAEIAGKPPLPSVRVTAQGPTSAAVRFSGGTNPTYTLPDHPSMRVVTDWIFFCVDGLD